VCSPSKNRSQQYYYTHSSGSKPGALIPTVISQFFIAKIDGKNIFFVSHYVLDAFHNNIPGIDR
jgi:hypothetical protein